MIGPLISRLHMEVEQVISAPKSYLARNANPIRQCPFNDFCIADSPHLATTNIAPPLLDIYFWTSTVASGYVDEPYTSNLLQPATEGCTMV